MRTDGYAWMTTRHVKVDSDAHFAVKRIKAIARVKSIPDSNLSDQYLEFWIRLGRPGVNLVDQESKKRKAKSQGLQPARKRNIIISRTLLVVCIF